MVDNVIQVVDTALESKDGDHFYSYRQKILKAVAHDYVLEFKKWKDKLMKA